MVQNRKAAARGDRGGGSGGKGVWLDASRNTPPADEAQASRGAMEAVDVYDGRRFLGTYKVRPHKVEAWGVDYEALGAFPSIEKAVAAILEAARARRAAG